MFKFILFAQLCLATLVLSAPSASKGVKRDIASPGSIANLFARDDDLYYNQNPAYAGGYGYYPRADVISPLYYNNGYGNGYGYSNGYGNGLGYGAGLGSAYPYYYGATAIGGWPNSLGYNGYRYGGYGAAGYGLGYGLGYY